MRRKSTPPPLSQMSPTALFQSAEEAWFWFIRCQKARDDGARFDGKPSLFSRPCEPDDVYRAIKELLLKRRITRQHVRVLNDYGQSERPPDPRCREEQHPHRLWNEALDRLASVLKRKEMLE